MESFLLQPFVQKSIYFHVSTKTEKRIAEFSAMVISNCTILPGGVFMRIDCTEVLDRTPKMPFDVFSIVVSRRNSRIAYFLLKKTGGALAASERRISMDENIKNVTLRVDGKEILKISNT